MLYRIRTYVINPNKLQAFNTLFYKYLLPNQLKFGATLVGRFVSQDKTKIIAIWSYQSMEQYQLIENKIKCTNLHKRAQAFRKQHDPLYINTLQEFFYNTLSIYEEDLNV